MARVDRNAALIALPALELRDRLASGTLRAVDLAKAYLVQIEAREPGVQAWAWHDPEFALDQAVALDAYRTSGRPIGMLHGLPVGIKDVIDTAKIPTENGTSIDAGRVPTTDAFVVAKLRAAGAIIMGKTVTAELAFLAAGKTHNPHNLAHSPGGSSSGSAAAVASRMVPLAIGTQTAGSVIRPAAFCGITGFKPSFGMIPRDGILRQSPSLDTVGVFAHTPEDAALIADVLCGFTASDLATTVIPPQRLLATALEPVPVRPDFAFVPTPAWDKADRETQSALLELVGMLGDHCQRIDLPAAFDQTHTIRRRIHLAEMANSYRLYESRARAELHEKTTSAIDEGQMISAADYLSALEVRASYGTMLDQIFDRFDVILTPAAPGPAPAGLDGTGDPVFNELWTLCGMPAVTLPLFASNSGMPIGLQLVGRRGNDRRLLRTARWLVEFAREAAVKGGS